MEEHHSVTSRWRQMVLVAALFFVRFIDMGVVKSFGVFLVDLVDQLDSDLGTIGMVIGSYHGISCILGKAR